MTCVKVSRQNLKLKEIRRPRGRYRSQREVVRVTLPRRVPAIRRRDREGVPAGPQALADAAAGTRRPAAWGGP